MQWFRICLLISYPGPLGLPALATYTLSTKGTNQWLVTLNSERKTYKIASHLS